MKKEIKLVKEKNFFQVLWDKKSVTEFDDDWVKGIEIQGYASTKDKDRWHDIVEPEAFKKALDLYMTNPVVLLQHNMDKPIWVVTEATIDNQGLFIKARITQDIDWVISAIKNGVLRAFSIWFRIKENSFEEYENDNGDRDYTNTIKDLELFEISVVSVPMNAYALMKSMQDCFEIKEVESEETHQDEDVPLDIAAEVPSEKEETAEEIPNEEAETQETSEEENSSESEETETEEKSEEVETEEVEEEEKSIEWEETAVETVAENESEATEETTEENPQAEETESESVEEETETKSVETETVEETENQADENSEIEETQEESDHSENDSETESNSWEVVEEAAKSLKDLQTKSVEKFISQEMKSIEKKFDDLIAKKDAKIKELEWKLEKTLDLLWNTIEVLWQVDKAVSNTVVKTWYTYQAPQTKRVTSRYSKLVDKLQNI